MAVTIRALFALPALAPVALRLYHHHVHIHVHVHGPSLGYAAIGLAALASWIGVPGPGEAALITAGLLAVHGRLDIGAVVAVGWLGALVGGVAGWILGVKGGRAVLAAPGPLHGLRLKALASGERLYDRYGVVAVLFTPPWMAGISQVRWTRFLPASAAATLAWALAIGLGAYFLGPPIADAVADAGLAGGALVAAAAVLALTRAVVARRRAS